MSASDSAISTSLHTPDLITASQADSSTSDCDLQDPMLCNVSAFDEIMQSETVEVVKGDTLWGIANDLGVALDDLLSVNRQIRDPAMIFPGQQINLPTGSSVAVDIAPTHTVRPGETMSLIAADNNMALSALLDANPQIRNPDVIFPGEVLNLTTARTQPQPGGDPADPPTQISPDVPVIGGEFNYDMIVGVAGNRNVTPQFIAQVEAMAQRLETKPEYLLATMSFETGGTFSPSITNPVSGATGLIQFIPPTAAGLGTSTSALASMSSVAQLNVVEDYFEQYMGKLGTVEGVYSSVLSGRATPNPNDTLHNFEGNHPNFRQNAGLDFNSDGRIASGEATTAVAARMYGGVGDVQRALIASGAVPDAQRTGFVDSTFGPATSQAIARFQQSQGLTATGYLDDATGRALFSNATDTANPINPGVNRPDAISDLRLSPPVHERATPARQTITSSVIGDFILTEGFMARGGPHSSKSATQAVFSDNPGQAEPIAAGVYNLGIDYVTTNGRIDTWFSGEVVDIINSNSGYGNRLIMRSDQTFSFDGSDYPVFAHYAHADSFNVGKGQRISAGQDIGDQGSTGHSTGDHVDFLTWIELNDGSRVYISPNLLASST